MIMQRCAVPPVGDVVRPVERRIRRALEKRQALSVTEICRLLALDSGLVVETLRRLVGAGEVERLRPVAYSAEDCDFYRLHRLDDRAFLWEQKYRESGAETPLTPIAMFRQARRWGLAR